MAGGSAKIGALHVSLGIDSASFTAGLAKAQGGLAGFGKSAGVAFAAIAAAGVAAGYALSKAMGGAINRFDDMGKAAQKVGTTTEALSRLEYAAKLSDVSFEQLTGGLTRLSKSLADVSAGGKGPAATAFAALGISVTNAAGQLRASDDVFADVADKFSRMEDGSTKTALSIGIFGKAGADLIPVLNAGRDGLKAYADESDRLGNTISGIAAANAEIFNDNITRTQTALQGVVNAITSAALPVFTYLSQKFFEAAGNGKLLEGFANGFVFVLKSVVSVAAIATTAIGSLGEGFATLMTAAAVASSGFQNWALAGKVLENGFTSLNENIAATTEFVNGLWATVDSGTANGEGGPLAPFVADMDAFSTSTQAAKDAQKELQQVMAEGQEVFTATRTPFENLQLEMDKLGNLLNKGAIDWDTYGRAVNAATMNAASTTIGALGQISGALAGAFKDNKAFAVANAVINTAEGVTKALAQGGFLGFAGAAAVAISGAAQVASILSASPGSGSVASVSTPAVAAPAATPGRALTINVAGGELSAQSSAVLDGIKQWLSEQGQELVIIHKGA